MDLSSIREVQGFGSLLHSRRSSRPTGIGELWTLSPVVPNGQRYRKLSRSVGSVGRRSLGCNAQYRFTSADQAKRPGFLRKLSRTNGRGRESVPIVREAVDTFERKGNVVMTNVARGLLEGLVASM